MNERFKRTEWLIGRNALEKIHGSHVAVFGIGGVGGYVCEALARAGTGELTIVDNDTVDETNINRQIIALESTIGKSKTAVMKERIRGINPECRVNEIKRFLLPDNSDSFDFRSFDYIVDAVDTVAAKIEIAVRAEEYGIPVISSMGTGNKLDPSAFKVADIYKTSVCPLAKVMRKELKARGVKKLKVVYSEEPPIKRQNGERSPASISFVPPVAGFIMAGEVIRDITGNI